MKVLHVLNELKFSGMEMMLMNSASEWKKNDVKIDIMSTGEKVGQASRDLESSGFQVFHIPCVKNKLRSILILRKFLRQNKYDIIHINTEANFLLHCLIARSTGHKNIVRTFHSIFQPRFLGKMRRHFDRKIAAILDVKYISVGDSVAQNELQNFYTKSKIIYNWYDDKRFLINRRLNYEEIKSKFKIPPNVFVLTSIGNCSNIKRHNLILEALSNMPKHFKWVYLHAGNEETNFPERKLANTLGISDNCRFLGSVSKVEDLLAASDVFIMSSKLEGLGNAAIEAMACGVPTVLTKAPGLTDIMNNINGVVGVDSNAENLVAGIEEILNMNHDERIKLGRNLSKQTSTKFSMKRGVNAYINFYLNISNH